MKYVILQTDRDGVTRVWPFIFPESVVHSEMAVAMQRVIRRGFNLNSVIRSAGFCHLHNNEFQTERGSESLKIPKGHPAQGHEDYKILNMPNAMHGILL